MSESQPPEKESETPVRKSQTPRPPGASQPLTIDVELGGKYPPETNLPAPETGGSLVFAGLNAPMPAAVVMTSARNARNALRIDPATAFLTRYTSENSRRGMEASLRVVAGILLGRSVTDVRSVPWEKVRYEHVQAVKARLALQYAGTSANRHLVALRGVVKEAWKLGLVDRETQEHVQNVESVKHTPRETGRALSQPEISALYAACGPDAAGRRDAAMLVMTLGAGLRRSEVCGVNLEDYEAATGRLQVLGKGNKYRTMTLPPKSRGHMDAWLKERGPVPGPLVTPMDKYGHPQLGKRLSTQGVYVLLQQLGVRAKVPQFKPHDLRRTFITRLLEKGADALVVSKLAGHSSVQTTMRYDKRGEKAGEAAMALLDD